MKACLKCKAPIVETRVYCDRVCTGVVPQHQGALTRQLEELYLIANRNGLYDAADFVQKFIDQQD